eukprot:TRINITY_DN16241_c0_g1_i1.p1 TRINITY_DN16241_c0_g1~~TRINITY_DN16241_c0_g1_i1.p1  ORF type:complete len:1099 (+),score=211.63 TRINITY_DN16241_c0_g1_i1:138-3434(+)
MASRRGWALWRTAVLCGALCSAGGMGNATAAHDALPTATNGEHFGVVIGISAVCVVACGAAALLTAAGRLLRLPVLAVVAAYASVWVVAVLTWYGTSALVRRVVDDRVEDIFQQAALVGSGVAAELGNGIAIARHIAAGAIDIHTSTYPATATGLVQLHESFGEGLLGAVFYATSQGRLMYYEPAGNAEAPGLIVHAAQPGIDNFPAAFACAPVDLADACGQLPTGDCGERGPECAATCRLPPSLEYCFVNPANATPNHVVFQHDPAAPTRPASLPMSWHFDPRGRAWFNTSHHGALWTAAAVVDWPWRARAAPVGAVASVVMRDRQGAPVGMAGVRYAWGATADLLRAKLPFPDAVGMLVSLEGRLLASSVAGTEGALGTDLSSRDIPDALYRPAARLRARYGSYARAAVHHTRSIVENEVVLASPLRLGGAVAMLHIVSFPLSHVLGGVGDASLRALALAVGLTVACTFAVFASVYFALRPLRVLANDMEHVAMLKLDAVDDRRSHAKVHEIHHMERSFDTILRHLTLFRQYVPSTMLDDALSVSATTTVFSAFVCVDAACADILRGCTQSVRRSVAAKHHSIIAKALDEYFGTAVKQCELAYFIRFENVGFALRFALAVQETIGKQQWPPELKYSGLLEGTRKKGYQLRIGVAAGMVSEETHTDGQREYSGLVVNSAEWLETGCVPGAVCCGSKLISNVDMQGVTKPLLFRSKALKSKSLDIKEVVMMVPASQSSLGPSVEDELRRKEREAQAAKARRRGSAGTRYERRRLRATPGLKRVVNATVICIQLRLSVFRHYRLRRKTRHDDIVSMGSIACDKVEVYSPTEATEPDQGMGGKGYALVEKVLVEIMTRLQRCQGNVCAVVGTAVYASWNATRQCTAHETQSMKFLRLTYGAHSDLVQISCGVTRGPVMLGHLGATGQKFFTIMGRSVAFSELLASTAVRLDTFTLLASMDAAPVVGNISAPCSKDISDDDSGDFSLLRPVDVWAMRDEEADEQTRNITIYELRVFASCDSAHSSALFSFYDDADDHEGFLTVPPGWTRAYADAFFTRNTDFITALTDTDPMLLRVVESMTKRVHLDRDDAVSTLPTTEVF